MAPAKGGPDTDSVHRRTAARISDRQITALIDEYLAGATVYERVRSPAGPVLVDDLVSFRPAST